MKKLLLKSLIVILLLGSKVYAQSNTNESVELKSDSKSRTYLGFGLSNSLISSLPNNSKQRIGFGLLLNSVSILAKQERIISSRFSLISGAELSLSFHEFDGVLSTSNNRLDLLKRNDSILSSLLTQSSIMVPLSIRFYFSENDHDKSNEYLQLGLRAGYGFLNGINNRTATDDYSLANLQSVSDINPLRYGVELVLGKKGARSEYFKNSSFSFFIQLSRFADHGNMRNVRPIQISWRMGI